jgi:hypothetical protein
MIGQIERGFRDAIEGAEAQSGRVVVFAGAAEV